MVAFLLTQVLENLYYAAKLLMPASTSRRSRLAAVREVMALMGLGSVAHQV
jgi:hypothetical protein